MYASDSCYVAGRRRRRHEANVKDVDGNEEI